jgi:hypothetical protein
MRMLVCASIAVQGIIDPILAGLLLAVEDGLIGIADTFVKLC